MVKGANPFVARMQDPQFQWQAAFVLFFLLSLGMGLGDGWIYTLGWGIMSIFALFFIFRGFPHMFPNALFLLLAYASVFGSVIAFFWVPTHRGSNLSVILGIFLEGTGIAFLLILVGRIWRVRDLLAERGKHVPLGFWTISVFVFFIFANTSMFSWGSWAKGDTNNRLGYIASEALIALMVFYILRVPEVRLGKELEPISIPGIPSRATGLFGRKAAAAAVKTGAKKGVKLCPVCHGPLRSEQRLCPGCSRERTFYWCPRSEAFFVECSRCHRMTSYEKDSCIFCSQPVAKGIKCSYCDASAPVSKWVLADRKKPDGEGWD